MKKILVVDDDPGILEAMEMILTLEGYTPVTSKRGDDARTLSENEHPYLIILDVFLSGHDGREIAKRLKENNKTKHIPILMMSAHPEVEGTIYDHGADGFVAKPFGINELTRQIDTLIN